MNKWIALAVITCLLLSLGSLAFADESYDEYWIESQGKQIYGRLYTPEGAVGPCPTVILSHGFGSTWE